MNFRQVNNSCKSVLKYLKLAYANKIKEKGICDLWLIANSILNKDKSAILPLFEAPEVQFSSSDKVKLFS